MSSVIAVTAFLHDRFEVGNDGIVIVHLGPLRSGSAESLVSRCHVSARLHEAPDPIEVDPLGGLVQRACRPLRELQRSPERIARMDGFAMGDDHALEGKVKHCTQVG